MARQVPIYYVTAEAGGVSLFHPTLKSAREEFREMVADGIEPTIHTLMVTMNRAGIARALNDFGERQ